MEKSRLKRTLCRTELRSHVDEMLSMLRIMCGVFIRLPAVARFASAVR